MIIFIRLNYLMNKLTKIKTLNTGYNWSITILTDGRLVSEDREKIIFYNKDNYEIESIYQPSERLIVISNFTELSSSSFCYCHNNLVNDSYKIKIIGIIRDEIIGSFYKERQSIKFKNNISKIVKVKKNVFITLSVDKTIKIWEFNKKKKIYFLKTSILINNYIGNDFNNMILINQRELCYYSKTYGIKSKHIIIFLDIKKGKNIKCINNIKCLTGKNTMLVKKNILIISATDGVYFIDISDYQMILRLKLDGYDFTIYNYKNRLLIYSRIYEDKINSYYLTKYELKDDKIVEKKNILLYIYNNQKYGLFDLIQKDNKTIITLDKYGSISIWNYSE